MGRHKSKFGLVGALLIAQCFCGVGAADADVIYTYTGNDFTSFGTIGGPPSATAYTTSDSVTGEFALLTPLGDNLTNYAFTPLSYSFNDGVDTLTPSNSDIFSTSFYVSTNGSGDITAWSIQLQGNLVFNSDDLIFTTTGLYNLINVGSPGDEGANCSANLANCTGIDYGTNSDPGVFAPISSTPLPAALPLFATGLAALGFLSWRRKRNAQAVTA